ncbi:hypothetical protein Tco_0755965, partial [Tanacetum coccineum]
MNLSPSKSLGFFRSHPSRRYRLWEMWDCQLGNLTAGKASGGGKILAMKELYDKVQASIKDSFKDFIPMNSEKEREMLNEREAKRLLRKRKATISEEQPSKKPKLRTET